MVLIQSSAWFRSICLSLDNSLDALQHAAIPSACSSPSSPRFIVVVNVSRCSDPKASSRPLRALWYSVMASERRPMLSSLMASECSIERASGWWLPRAAAQASSAA